MQVKRSTKAIVGLVVFVVVGFVAAALILGKRDTVASPNLLTINFGEVVFGSDFNDRVDQRVLKWVGPIRMALVGEVGEYEWEAHRYVKELARLTNLDISFTHEIDRNQNFTIYFVKDRREMLEKISLFLNKVKSNEEIKDTADRSECIAIHLTMGRSAYLFFGWPLGAISIIKSIIPVHLKPDLVKDCILEEITQSLGLWANSDLIEPSIFHSEDVTELSINDKILIRTLYDPRIYPDMPRVEAMEVARMIITELVLRIEAGEDPDVVLNQKPRQKKPQLN